jgi:hypothetical protein
MKKLFVCFLLLLSQNLLAQGYFAGSYKYLLEKTYREETELDLAGFVSRGGSLISDAADPDKFAVSWFSKNSVFVVLFELVKEDNSRQILDVLEIKNVSAGQEFKIGDCKDGDNEIVSIAALVSPTKAERVKAIKAWHFNRDKIRIEAWPASDVTCLGLVGDD